MISLVNNLFSFIFIILFLYPTYLRSIRPEVFCDKGALKNFLKFKGEHLRQNLFFNKVAGLKLEFY